MASVTRAGAFGRALFLAGLVAAAAFAALAHAKGTPSAAQTGARGSLAQAAVASRSGWLITPSPNPRARNGELLFGTCTSASSCIGVGTRETASKVGVTLVERWNDGRWRVQRTPNPAGARVSLFNGVGCSSRAACTAVGDALSASGKETTLAERWNGHRWRIESTPNPAGSPKSVLFGVACPSRSACIAVGQTFTSSGVSRPLVERWNGHRWRIQRVSNPAGVLSDVSCTAPSACTAVGVTNPNLPDQRTLALRWNGRRWRSQRTPNPSQGGGFLFGVACTASSSCTAVGGSNAGTLVERWNGRRWAIQPTPNPPGAQFGFLNGVGCSSRSACTAVGAYGNSSGHLLTLAERWNGRKWRIQRTSSPYAVQGDFLLGVACPSPEACTAFGFSRFSNGSGTPLTMAQRWNGHRWRLQGTRNPAGARGAQLLGISCTSPSSCMAVGQTTAGTLAERWNGTKWAIEPTPNPAGTGASGLEGVSCTSRSSCTAVGAAFTTFDGNSVGTLAERWNGHRWRIQPTPTSHSRGFFLGGVSCTSASACTATGSTASGLLAERWNGHKWSIQQVPNPPGAASSGIGAVSCASASVCTAVGAAFDSSGNLAGTVAERWNGHRWRIQPTPTSKSAGSGLGAVSCSSASACTAVGNTASGLLAERWNGTAWSVQATPTPPGTQGNGDFLNGVSCPSRSACTAFGLAFTPFPTTVAERWNGTKWRIQPTPNLPGVYDLDAPAVSCPTTSICRAVGGYTNNGVKLTLAERWHAGRAGSELVTRPSRSVSRSLACARPLANAPFVRRELRLPATSAESCALGLQAAAR